MEKNGLGGAAAPTTTATAESPTAGPNESMAAKYGLNVFKKPLLLHSTSPLTGFLRTGYCTAPASDAGNHSVAAVVTEDFLDFTASRGNDLRGGVGLKGGCKWCLCVSRWREALEASRRGEVGVGKEVVPRVFLNMTSERALEGARMEDLREFAVDKEL